MIDVDKLCRCDGFGKGNSKKRYQYGRQYRNVASAIQPAVDPERKIAKNT